MCVCVCFLLLSYLFNNHSLDSKKKTSELTKSPAYCEEYGVLRS